MTLPPLLARTEGIKSRPRKAPLIRSKEIALHTSLVKALRLLIMPGWKFWHTANGEKRDPRTAAKLKAMGVLPGVPDIVLISPTGKNRQRLSDLASARMAARPANTNHTKAKGGRREDLGETWFRSSWEANYARYLNLLIKLGVVVSWEFEPETFWFEEIKRGVRSYLPDFKVFYKGDPKPVYVEVKGWVVDKDKTKWKRMAKYHPNIKLEVVGVKEYRAIRARWGSQIPNWEGK